MQSPSSSIQNMNNSGDNTNHRRVTMSTIYANDESLCARNNLNVNDDSFFGTSEINAADAFDVSNVIESELCFNYSHVSSLLCCCFSDTPATVIEVCTPQQKHEEQQQQQANVASTLVKDNVNIEQSDKNVKHEQNVNVVDSLSDLLTMGIGDKQQPVLNVQPTITTTLPTTSIFGSGLIKVILL
jgi:hypothetical protein